MPSELPFSGLMVVHSESLTSLRVGPRHRSFHSRCHLCELEGRRTLVDQLSRLLHEKSSIVPGSHQMIRSTEDCGSILCNIQPFGCWAFSGPILWWTLQWCSSMTRVPLHPDDLERMSQQFVIFGHSVRFNHLSLNLILDVQFVYVLQDVLVTLFWPVMSISG